MGWALEKVRGDEMKTITLQIPGISCGHCLMTIKREASMVMGVQFISGDVAAKTATFQVESDEALANLTRALEEAGYVPA
jgi:copper chaperone CopZ